MKYSQSVSINRHLITDLKDIRFYSDDYFNGSAINTGADEGELPWTSLPKSGGVSRSASLRVNVQPAVSGVGYANKNFKGQLPVGKTTKLTPVSGDGKKLTLTGIKWSVSDPSVLTVTEKGVVTGIGEGEAIVTLCSPGGEILGSAPGTVKVTGVTVDGKCRMTVNVKVN